MSMVKSFMWGVHFLRGMLGFKPSWVTMSMMCQWCEHLTSPPPTPRYHQLTIILYMWFSLQIFFSKLIPHSAVVLAPPLPWPLVLQYSFHSSFRPLFPHQLFSHHITVCPGSSVTKTSFTLVPFSSPHFHWFLLFSLKSLVFPNIMFPQSALTFVFLVMTPFFLWNPAFLPVAFYRVCSFFFFWHRLTFLSGLFSVPGSKLLKMSPKKNNGLLFILAQPTWHRRSPQPTLLQIGSEWQRESCHTLKLWHRRFRLPKPFCVYICLYWQRWQWSVSVSSFSFCLSFHAHSFFYQVAVDWRLQTVKSLFTRGPCRQDPPPHPPI